MPHRIISIDIIKIIAIIWIILAHLLDQRHGGILGIKFTNWSLFDHFYEINQNWLKSFLQTIIACGGSGANLFFLISGLGLTLKYKPNLSYFNFLKKRLFKLLPLYWLILIILFFLSFIKIYPIKITWLDFTLHFSLIHPFFKNYLLSLSAPLWFMGIIFQFYLIFPFLYFLAKKINPILFLIGSLALQFILYPLLSEILLPGSKFFVEGLFIFCSGIVFAKFLKKKKNISKYWILFLPLGILFLFLPFLIQNKIISQILYIIYLFSSVFIFFGNF